jgi:hypothetical protein
MIAALAVIPFVDSTLEKPGKTETAAPKEAV